jgi:hypothetical protein
MGFEGKYTFDWSHYIELLVLIYFILQDDEDDTIVWSRNPIFGEYTTKMGYQAAMESSFSEDNHWWWEIL